MWQKIKTSLLTFFVGAGFIGIGYIFKLAPEDTKFTGALADVMTPFRAFIFMCIIGGLIISLGIVNLLNIKWKEPNQDGILGKLNTPQKLENIIRRVGRHVDEIRYGDDKVQAVKDTMEEIEDIIEE